MPSTRALALILLCLSIAGCTVREGPAPSPQPSGGSAPAASAVPSSAGPSGPSAGTSASEPAARGSVGLDELERVEVVLEPSADGLSSPLDLTNAGDGSGRVYVAQQAGTIRAYEADGTELPEPYLEIGDRISAGGERGLLGLAFHPDFAENGRFFVNYTDRRGNTVVAEYHGDADRADPGSERILLGFEQPYPNHNGGGLAFDRDGDLLIATGDGGSGGDPHGNGQSLETLLGKILRVDVDAGASGDRAYGIPEGNPFSGRADARPEILHYGMRNPFRISVDRETGDLWMGDVGQSSREELDRAPAGSAGLNFGWNLVEGDRCYHEDPCDEPGLTPPIVSYGRDVGSVVTGGHVYRGRAQPLLNGVHVFADFASGAIFGIPAAIVPAQPITEPPVLAATDLSIAGIGEDEAGELYAVDLGGSVWRITARER
jgi:glucose/arabinose dehydrogenase